MIAKKEKDNRVRKMRAVVIDESANRKKSSAVSQVAFCHVTLTSLANEGKHRRNLGKLTGGGWVSNGFEGKKIKKKKTGLCGGDWWCSVLIRG